MYSTDQNYLITTLNRQDQSDQAEPTWQKREQIDHTRHKWTRKWTKTSDKRVTIPNCLNRTARLHQTDQTKLTKPNWPNQTDQTKLTLSLWDLTSFPRPLLNSYTRRSVQFYNLKVNILFYFIKCTSLRA